MMLTCAFVSLFSLLSISLAANVSIYDGVFNFPSNNSVPAAVSQLPWEFSFESGTIINMKVIIINKPLNVTDYNVTYSEDYGMPQQAVIYFDRIFFFIMEHVNSTAFKINLNLYSSKGLCSSLLVAEGRTDWPETEKPNYNTICSGWCELWVDISDQCVDPPSDTKSTTTTTLKPVVKHVTSNNVTDYVPTSPHAIIETTTIKVTTNGTNTATVTIICSTIGVVVVLLVVIAVWIYWSKRNTPQLPTIPPSDPFYLNMLFRRQCDQEIAEIEQHHYYEIEELQNKETENQYEEIN